MAVPSSEGGYLKRKLQIQGFSSGIKHIIGRTDTRQYFYRLHSSCFAFRTLTGIITFSLSLQSSLLTKGFINTVKTIHRLDGTRKNREFTFLFHGCWTFKISTNFIVSCELPFNNFERKEKIKKY